MKRTSLLALLAALSCGCSSIPESIDRSGATRAEESKPLKLAVAPIEIELAEGEGPKQYEAKQFVNPRELTKELAGWADDSRVFQETRPVVAAEVEDVYDDAWAKKDDLLLRLALQDYAVTFEGHNNWWIPNILNWVFWIVPSWFVATEEYSLSFDAHLSLESVDSHRVLHKAILPISVTYSFDEFDRGWQFFGFIFPNNDGDNWRQIATKLMPAATHELGKALTKELVEQVRDKLGEEATRTEMSKTLCLVVGVSHYQDEVQLPPLNPVGNDGRNLAAVLVNPQAGNGLQDRHVYQLIGSDATREAVDKKLQELQSRLRKGDQLLLYFAGYGTRLAGGAPALLLSEAQADGSKGALGLKELATRLAAMPARKLVIIDASFDGKGRSVLSKHPAPADAKADLAAFGGSPDTGVILASSPGETLSTPAHLEGGLFSYHLIRGLSGKADEDKNGSLTAQELFRFARDQTLTESAFEGAGQHARELGLDAGFALEAPTGADAELQEGS